MDNAEVYKGYYYRKLVLGVSRKTDKKYCAYAVYDRDGSFIKYAVDVQDAKDIITEEIYGGVE